MNVILNVWQKAFNATAAIRQLQQLRINNPSRSLSTEEGCTAATAAPPATATSSAGATAPKVSVTSEAGAKAADLPRAKSSTASPAAPEARTAAVVVNTKT